MIWLNTVYKRQGRHWTTVEVNGRVVGVLDGKNIGSYIMETGRSPLKKNLSQKKYLIHSQNITELPKAGVK